MKQIPKKTGEKKPGNNKSGAELLTPKPQKKRAPVEPKATEQIFEIDNSQTVIIEPKTASQAIVTEGLKLQTEQMEVHHHPEVEKKRFKRIPAGRTHDIYCGNDGFFCGKPA